jgi:hypothetical protein
MKFFDYKNAFEGMSETEYLNLVAHMRKQFDKFDLDHRQLACYGSQNNGMKSSYTAILNRAVQANFNRPGMSRKLAPLLLKTLNGIYLDIEQYSSLGRSMSDSKSNSIIRRFRRLYRKMSKLVTSTENLEVPKLVSGFEFTNKVLPVQQTSLPGLNSQIDKVKSLVLVAKASPLETEEKYFLQQIEEDYLPNIVSTGVNIRNASENIKKEAQVQFLKQLNSIETELMNIIDGAASKMLQGATIQTNFLETKLGKSQGKGELTV